MPTGPTSSSNENREEALRLVACLSRLENEILGGLVNGHSVGSIAAILSLAPAQVERTKGSMMLRLSALATADAIRIGLYAGVQWEH